MRLALFALLFFFGAISLTPSTVALVAALAAPVVSYLVAARRFSGKIETTEAKELWAESRSIRDWSIKRIEILNDLVSKLETRVRLLEEENERLRRELRDKVDV